ncbi:amino acid transporter [Candidatus Micrarchaeota archaeon]|nr:MAG: amino acid transporter [Candidatus Micrarchaeota archaeon]
MAKLKRSLNFTEVTLTGVGIILGAGIYALIGQGVALTGNSVWLALLFGGIIAMFTGMSYAELSSMFPEAGAEYEYASEAFGKRLALALALLIVIGAGISGSVVALGFGGYLSHFVNIPMQLSALLLIVASTGVLLYGVKESAWLGIIFTIIEALGLFIIIAIGIPHLGGVDYFEMPHGLTGLLSATALMFFAFVGFGDICKLSEETKKAKKIIPIATISAIAISTLLYVLVGLAVISILPWQELASSDAPVAVVAQHVLGSKGGTTLAMIALFSTSNTLLLFLLATSRLMYGVAEKIKKISKLAWVHPRFRTPWYAILFVSTVSAVFIFAGSIREVAFIGNFSIFVTYIVVNAANIYIRVKMPKIKRGFRAGPSFHRLPVISVLGLLSSVFLLLNLSKDAIIYGSAITLLSLALSYLLVKPSAKK